LQERREKNHPHQHGGAIILIWSCAFYWLTITIDNCGIITTWKFSPQLPRLLLRKE
jgi:hypothetical protein